MYKYIGLGGTKMNIIDINREGTKIIVIIHPMLSSATGMKEELVDCIGGDYRYIIPDLAGHGETKGEYNSVEEEAKKIIEYLLQNGITKVLFGYGASLGGVVLLKIFENEAISFGKCVFEGCSLWENSYILEFVLKNIFVWKHRKALKNRKLAEEKISKLYGVRAGRVMADTFIQMSENSIKNIIHDCSNVDIPKLSKEEQEKCIFCYGEKEFDLRGARKVIPKKLPYVKVKMWKGYDHCEKVTKDNGKYCEFLIEEIEKVDV